MSAQITVRRRMSKIALGMVAASGCLVGGAYQFGLRASLPQLNGNAALDGLEQPVTVERDALGVAHLRASTRLDLARALGFVHAQERFFQMDLARRRGAGELSELVGRPALPLDKQARIHLFRHRAREALTQISPKERSILEAYAGGVNAGLDALARRPFEYLVLRQQPRPWSIEDTYLVLASMYFQLNDELAEIDETRTLVFDSLPEALAAYLTPSGTEWDAPIRGAAMKTPSIPGPEVIDLRDPSNPSGEPVKNDEVPTGNASDSFSDFFNDETHHPGEGFRVNIGSNNWAVAGFRSKHGGALLSSDMHLGHGVPNIWFRVQMEWTTDGEDRSLVGMTLPGTPALVAGSNGHVAWGFTNSNGDWSDLVLLEQDSDGGGETSYLTPSGSLEFERYAETIAIRGEASVPFEVLTTIWGPVRPPDYDGRRRAIRWIAHDPDSLNLELLRLETAETIEDAISIGPTMGIPPQNLVVVDATGNVGWTIAGRIPNRFGFDGRRASSWADGSRGWNGWLPAEDYPKVMNPQDGFLWTANARVIDGDDLERIGDGGYALGARAKQIRDGLRELDSSTEQDMLAIQLDDRALFLSQWRAFLLLELGALLEKSPSDELEQLRSLIRGDWSGRASPESSGYRLVRASRSRLRHLVLSSLTAAVRQRDPNFRVERLDQTEVAVWKILNEKPAHLVPPPHADWHEAIRSTLTQMVDSLTEEGAALDERTWGQRNQSSIRHPLSGAVGPLSRWLDMPSNPLPGDGNMPRVQNVSHGASGRLVVSPGKENSGIFHMPGGQSGHPLSPYYGAGHEDWEQGRPTPLLPGETVYRLVLSPPR